MKPGVLLLLFLSGLALALAAASWQHVPGYMDAEYSYAGALRLAQGQGFSEMILWNYLDDPAGLPHPSHAYWMPLATMVAAAGLWLGDRLPVFSTDFAAARLFFVLMAACVPALTSWLSWRLVARVDLALVSGLLALFGGFYVPYMTTTDSFALVMLLGSALLLAIPVASDPGCAPSRRWKVGFLTGLLAGLMHLVRADGLLWLSLAAGILIWRMIASDRSALRVGLIVFGALLAGYFLCMGPWMVRNLIVFGAPLAPGGGRVFWLTDYNELFIYPAVQLSTARWWSSGLADILGDRWWALGTNLQSAVAVQGLILLGPLVIAASWRLRDDWRVRTAWSGWLLTLFAMTIVFPYAGARGGFFHSGAALQPFFWALAPYGLQLVVEWVGKRRTWNIPRAGRVFQVVIVTIAILLSVFIYANRVIGFTPGVVAWETGVAHYREIELALADWGANPDEMIMVNNPPAYYVANQRPAIAIPDGGVQALLEAASRYQGKYLVLEFNQLRDADDLYAQPGDRPGLRYLGSVDETRIYRFDAP